MMFWGKTYRQECKEASLKKISPCNYYIEGIYMQLTEYTLKQLFQLWKFDIARVHSSEVNLTREDADLKKGWMGKFHLIDLVQVYALRGKTFKWAELFLHPSKLYIKYMCRILVHNVHAHTMMCEKILHKMENFTVNGKCIKCDGRLLQFLSEQWCTAYEAFQCKHMHECVCVYERFCVLCIYMHAGQPSIARRLLR